MYTAEITMRRSTDRIKQVELKTRLLPAGRMTSTAFRIFVEMHATHLIRRQGWFGKVGKVDCKRHKYCYDEYCLQR